MRSPRKVVEDEVGKVGVRCEVSKEQMADTGRWLGQGGIQNPREELPEAGQRNVDMADAASLPAAGRE